MKNRLLSLVPLVAIILTLAASFAPLLPHAGAANIPDSSGPKAQVTLSGTTTPDKYVVTGKWPGSNTAVKFSFNNGAWTSGTIAGISADSCANQQQQQQHTLTISITAGGKAAGGGTIQFCNGPGFTYQKSIAVTSVAGASNPASVAGSINYKDDNGAIKPFQSDAVGTLKGPSGNLSLKFDDNGKITNTGDLDSLTPGSYTIDANYVPSGGQNQNYTKTFTLAAGQHFVLSNALAGNAVNGNANGTPANAATDNSVDNTLQCNTTYNPATWFMCPIVRGLVTVVDQLDDLITSQLSVGSPGNTSQPVQIFCPAGQPDANASCGAYRKAWSSFRNIALGLLVIVGLVVLISQALGSELLDAYTIRKILPRLLIAAVTITLSWQLMQFFVTFTNDLGYGIRYLIYQPFAGIGGAALGGGGQTALFFIGSGAILALSIVGLLSFAATAALAVAIAFLVLVIRQLLVIVLVVLAPIAIIAYILPNTQNVYKIWWDSFAKALLMFPIIAAFIATGHVFAVVASANSDSTVGQLVGFVAYFAPYFLLPLTFRLAGGALRNIGGFVNDRGRGGFDRLRNYRGKKVQSNMSALAAGNRYKATNPLANSINRTGRFAANAGSAGITPWKMKSRYQSGISQQKMSAIGEYMEKSEAFKAMSGNDDYLQATMKSMGGGSTEDDWRRYLRKNGYEGRSLEQGVAAIRAAKRDTNDEVFAASAVLANFGTGTGFKEGGIGQAMAAINEVSGGDRDMAARMTAQSRGVAERAQRWDLAAPGFGAHYVQTNQMYDQFQAIDSDRTLTAAQKADRKNDVMKNTTTDLLEKGFYVKGGAGSVVQMRGDSAKQLAPRMVKRIQDRETTAAAARQAVNVAQLNNDDEGVAQHSQVAAAAERELAQEYAALGNIQDQMNYATPEVARILADTVFDHTLANGKTVSEGLEDMKNSKNSAYNQARSDFQSRQTPGGEPTPEQTIAAQRAGMLPGTPIAPPPPPDK